MTKGLLFSLLIVVTTLSGFYMIRPGKLNISIPAKEKIDPAFLHTKKTKWVDSVFNSLSDDEKIAQLFMVAAYSNRDQEHIDYLDSLIKNYNIGGLIFFQGGPVRQANLTNHYQKISKTPLMISIDAEWGLAMRLDSTMKFPKQMTLGAIKDDQLIFEMGKEIAYQCKRLGMQVNLAPVADINNNPNNPIINYRSFGENKYEVAKRALKYMQGMQSVNVLANAKHFPGHGDTDSDSHKTLPIITHDLKRLDSIELFPFKVLIDSGLSSMMVAHLYIPALDSTPNRASTLSKRIVTDLLKNELGFKGLVFTDALNMRGVSAFYNPGELDVEALIAGNDVLLFSEDVPLAIQKIKEAIADGRVSQKDIDEKCKHILEAKAWTGLDKVKPVDLNNLYADLHSDKAQYLNTTLFENALTLIKNDSDLVPIKHLENHKIASISIGADNNNAFNQSIERYDRFDMYSYPLQPEEKDFTQAKKDLESNDLLIITIHDMNQRPYQNFGISNRLNAFIEEISKGKQVVLNILGNPYCIKKFTAAEKANAILISYEDHPITKDLSGQLIFGGIPAKGKLPVSVSENFPIGTGIITNESIRFNYTSPYKLGINPVRLEMIDTLMNNAIKKGVFPGGEIFAAKDGKVFYYKGFGYHTYDSTSKQVETSDIYDLASITKIASSTAALMRLQAEGLVNVDSTLGYYLPDMVDSTAYANIKLKEMLAHQAGFEPWIPFYLRTLHKGQPKFELYSIKESDYFNQRVAKNLYASETLRDTIFKRILGTSVSPVKKYKYSDIGYYFINEIIRRVTHTTQDKYVDSVFYSPMGLQNIGYKPRERFDITRIPPTENDQAFRHQVIQADVHDQGAAMMGGVAGHAGLFSNANDLAVMMQMFMQYGKYGGEQILDSATVKYFTTSPYYTSNNNRRGIGFDKPVREGGSGPTCSLCTSNESFGHSGFTGTVTWADPKSGLVYVFLSNRVYPDAMNQKIISLSIRTRIQKILTDAINEAKVERKIN